MSSLRSARRAALLVVSTVTASAGFAKSAVRPRVVPVPPLPDRTVSADPVSPPAQHVHSDRAHLSLDLPAGWTLARHDGEISTFAFDARSSLPATRMDLVAGMGWNPFPSSTFAGALFYVSQTPHATARDCTDQASSPLKRPVTTVSLDGVSFQHGYAEHGSMCTESRDEVYTALRANACLRFDLVINTFCTQGSGAQEITPGQLASIEHRLDGILGSVRFDPARQTPTASRAH